MLWSSMIQDEKRIVTAIGICCCCKNYSFGKERDDNDKEEGRNEEKNKEMRLKKEEKNAHEKRNPINSSFK